MVDAVSSFVSNQTNVSNSSSQLAENFDTFLSLLTAQLQNQDPLEPVDSTQFTQQLVQFSGVEQQIQTNQNLGDLIAMTASSTAASLSNYLGKTIEIDSLTADLGDDGIELVYDLPQGVESADFAIISELGRTVYSGELDTDAGQAELNWSGSTDGGTNLLDGTYTLVIRAVDGSGETLNVPVHVRSKVNAIDLSTGTTALSTGAGVFTFSQILRLISET